VQNVAGTSLRVSLSDERLVDWETMAVFQPPARACIDIRWRTQCEPSLFTSLHVPYLLILLLLLLGNLLNRR